MLDFWLPMILLFVAATVTAIAARRKRDRFDVVFPRNKALVRHCLR